MLSLTAESVLLSDLDPIIYGDENFRSRILEQTEGKRDPIGLVLTGSSSKALSHIGLIKYLEEINLKPDYIVSSSMSSIVASLYAYGFNSDQILTILTNAETEDLFDLNAITSIASAKGLLSYISYFVNPKIDIGDLEIPLMVVCEDLVTLREVALTEGDLINVVEASMAYPVYFTPVEHRGHLLIDSSVASLAPISLAYNYSDTLILSTYFEEGNAVNLYNPLNNYKRANSILKARETATMLEDKDIISINSSLKSFSFLDFSKVEEMSAIKYKDATKLKDELTVLDGNKTSSKIINIDNKFEKLEELKSNFNKIPSSLLSFTSIEQMHNDSYLNTEDNLALQMEVGNTYFDIWANGGVSYKMVSLANSSFDLVGSAGLNFYPLSFVHFSTSLDARLLEKTINLKQGLDVIVYKTDDLKLSLIQDLEVKHDLTKYNYLLSSGFNLDFTYNNLNTNTLVSLLSKDSKANFINLDFDSKLYYYKTAFVSLDLNSRYQISGAANSLDLYIKDGFYSNANLYSPGIINQNYFVNLAFSAGYDIPPLQLGDLLVIKDLSVAAYCDALFYKGLVPAGNAGFEFKFNPSYIALGSFPITLRTGYETITDSFIMSLFFSLEM